MRAWRHLARAVLAGCLAVCAFLAQAGVESGRLQAWLARGEHDRLDTAYEQVRQSRQRTPEGEFDHELFFGHIRTFDWERADRQTTAWWTATRSLPGAIARARALLDRADDLERNGGWGRGDAPVAEAHQVLLAVQAKGRGDANWHATLLGVARLQGWQPARVHAALEAAAAADPLPLTPYLAAAAALSPDRRTPGTELARIAKLAERSTAASEGRSMYARVFLGAAADFAGVSARPFATGHMEWQRLHPALLDWQARYPQADVLSQHAALACLAGDVEVTASLFARLGADPRRHHFDWWGGPPLYQRCQQSVQKLGRRI